MATNLLKIIIPNPASRTRIRVTLDQPGQNINRIRINVVKSTRYITTTVNVISTVCNKAQYPLGFNGKMKVDEVAGKGNHVDFGERGLNTRTGRWFTRDKLEQKYPSVSPYVFALNSPIQAKDPDGRVVIFINGIHTPGDVGSKYWGLFDTRVMNRIGDHNSRYYDGSLGGWSNTSSSLSNNNLSAENRFMAGYNQGIADAKDIINHLQRDDEGNITESVKIISHSMGGAYAKGFTAALNHYAIDAANNEYLGNSNPTTLSGHPYYPDGTMKGFKIDYEVDFASFQPNSVYNAAIPGIKTIQVSHKYDAIVNNGTIGLGSPGSHETREKGVSLGDYHLNTTNPNKGHSIQDFKDEINYVPNSGGSSAPAPSALKE